MYVAKPLLQKDFTICKFGYNGNAPEVVLRTATMGRQIDGSSFVERCAAGAAIVARLRASTLQNRKGARRRP
jgi:hypothetical protein